VITLPAFLDGAFDAQFPAGLFRLDCVHECVQAQLVDYAFDSCPDALHIEYRRDHVAWYNRKRNKNGDALVASGAIQALIDGQPYSPRQRPSSFTLKGVERGEHSLQVRLVDSAGKVIASSDAVKFYMWQASALFPGRKR